MISRFCLENNGLLTKTIFTRGISTLFVIICLPELAYVTFGMHDIENPGKQLFR